MTEYNPETTAAQWRELAVHRAKTKLEKMSPQEIYQRYLAMLVDQEYDKLLQEIREGP